MGDGVMNNLTIGKNELFLMRYTELIRISACGNNAIRFQSFPDCQMIEENYTLMPQAANAEIEEFDNYATLTCGRLKVKIENITWEWRLIHIVVWQKPTQHCKATILSLKINLKKENIIIPAI